MTYKLNIIYIVVGMHETLQSIWIRVQKLLPIHHHNTDESAKEKIVRKMPPDTAVKEPNDCDLYARQRTYS